MNLAALITDLEKLVVDATPLVADVEAIIADIEASPSDKPGANGQILAALLAMIQSLASNPALQQIIVAILGGLLKPANK